MFVGTITNVATVIAGTMVGALAGRRFPDRLRETVTATLGLLTAALAVREIVKTDEFVLVLAAVLAGAVLGELARIEAGLNHLGDALQRWAGRRAAVALDVDAPETTAPPVQGGRFSEGFVVASLVFCVGPLAVIGSIQDGLGDPDMLLAKAALDGFASLAFASVYGWGVGVAALSVGLYQGAIALGGHYLDGVLTAPLEAALASAGGVLLLGISLRLLGLKEVRVANLLPAVVLAPLFVYLWA